MQGGTTKQSAANNSSRLTEGERLWRPEKIAAVAVAPSQSRLKAFLRTAVIEKQYFSGMMETHCGYGQKGR
jgi:hypothetical protein